ncbi:helicase [Ureibacillus aquaedulcis]|uniref:Helicase n=1 Tax=Ureibacillus aquaedulcis TaxID=3058421 RepID=A0ABT8GMH9_9BACL|nr:helicase [Ureibacillus sp. BA0131]MDN4492612.1 helicase [Ureibacillus sp. BA0131]
MKLSPDGPGITRTLEIGGLTKFQLMEQFKQHSIMMNNYGERLFFDGLFTTSETKYSLQIVELTVRQLGFPEGATLPQLFNQANELGLKLCPLELGPYLRLEYLDQTEGNTNQLSLQNSAPSGSITIASELVRDDDDFPKGFYIRKIDGVLWLRGYLADSLHVWNPDDRFIFCIKENQ